MARSIYLFNTHDLPHRAGEMREHQLDLKIPEAVGVDLLSVKTGCSKLAQELDKIGYKEFQKAI